LKAAIINAGHLDRGGTERVVAHQARGLVERGYEVEILAPTYDSSVYSEVIPEGVSIRSWWHSIPLPILGRTVNRLLHFWLGGGELAEFDVLVAHNQPAPYVSYKCKKKYGVRYVAFIHAPWRRLYPREVDLESGWASDYRERIMFLRRSYWYSIDQESVRAADARLANSVKVKGEVERVYGVDAGVCYPGLDSTWFESDASEDLGAEGNEWTILVVGRHAPQKRLEWVPTVLVNLLPEFPRVRAIVTGKPNVSDTPRLWDEARRLGVENRVKLVGSVPDSTLKTLYRSCPVLAYTAVMEDFGLPPVEAMACGCVPVIWGEQGGPSEAVIDGETGLHAKPYDLNDFSRKVALLLSDERMRRRMALEGSKRARSFTWEAHLDTLERTIKGVVGD
jgi:glycosyltransferase involved in cell wall biosynthesis